MEVRSQAAPTVRETRYNGQMDRGLGLGSDLGLERGAGIGKRLWPHGKFGDAESGEQKRLTHNQTLPLIGQPVLTLTINPTLTAAHGSSPFCSAGFARYLPFVMLPLDSKGIGFRRLNLGTRDFSLLQ